MNYFSKYRYAIWTIIVLAIIIITAVITSVIFNHNRKAFFGNKESRFHEMGKMLHNELGLNADQDAQFKQMHEEYFNDTRAIFKKLEEQRIRMIEEFTKDKPDTVLLYHISDTMGILHARLKHETVNHLLHLRAICTPEQVKKLTLLNKELIGPEGPMRRLEHRKRLGPPDGKSN